MENGARCVTEKFLFMNGKIPIRLPFCPKLAWPAKRTAASEASRSPLRGVEAGELTYAFLPQALLGWQNGQQRAKRVGGQRPLAPADICFANGARCVKTSRLVYHYTSQEISNILYKAF